MTVLFLACLAALLHAYAGYPLSLAVLRLLRGDRSRHRTEAATPPISLVIAAYNEERVIREKIENSLALDYPHALLKVVVASDASSDRTADIAREYADRGVLLRHFPERQGKVACLNRVIPDLLTPIVVMSDANSLYAKDSLRKLVRHFADERIGCVCGALQYANRRRLASGEGERFYWRFEGLIKGLESSLGSLLGANGAIYAFRRALFRPVDPLMFCDDVIPGRIAADGHLAIYDPEAVCLEEAAEESVEWRRRRRHASFGLRSMLHLAGLAARGRRILLLYECLSHRIIRWMGGLALLGMLVSAPFLPGGWRTAAIGAQVALYGSAGIGFLLSRAGVRRTPFYLPYYFLVINSAGIMGLAACLRGSDRPYWEPRQ